jgi:polar amino acid transport system substrate-binding protein
MPCNRFCLLIASTILALPGVTASAGTLQEVLSRGELRVGVALAAPWAMRDDDGNYRGFEIDVAEKLAADMEVSVDFRRYDYGRLILALESGEIDLIAAGLTISPQRALHVNFSRPYAVGGVGIATNLESTANVGRLEELNDPAFTIAVMADTAGELLAERIMPRARLEAYRSETDATDALISGNVDVYLDEEPIPTFLALEYPNLIDVPVNDPLVETRSAFAVTKGDADFLAFLNAWIEAREADTWLPTTHYFWFKTLQWQE